MGLTTRAVTVTTSATELLSPGSGDRRAGLVHVPSGGATVHVGASNVTTANGIPVGAGSSLALNEATAGDAIAKYGLYGIVATGTQDVRVMEVTT